MAAFSTSPSRRSTKPAKRKSGRYLKDEAEFESFLIEEGSAGAVLEISGGTQIAGEDLKRLAREAMGAKRSIKRLHQRAPDVRARTSRHRRRLRAERRRSGSEPSRRASQRRLPKRARTTGAAASIPITRWCWSASCAASPSAWCWISCSRHPAMRGASPIAPPACVKPMPAARTNAPWP